MFARRFFITCLGKEGVFNLAGVFIFSGSYFITRFNTDEKVFIA